MPRPNQQREDQGVNASDRYPDAVITFIDPQTWATTCHCGNKHYWTQGEDYWRCEKCENYIYQKHTRDANGGDSW